jgi:hypothetical protein
MCLTDFLIFSFAPWLAFALPKSFLDSFFHLKVHGAWLSTTLFILSVLYSIEVIVKQLADPCVLRDRGPLVLKVL